MPMAAVPAYLGQDFKDASPGLRFGMYLPLWGIDNRTGEHLWGTHDVNHRVAGRERREREYKDENKRDSLRQSCRLTRSDIAAMKALQRRQDALAAPLAAAGHLMTLDARAVAPFTTGLGNEHPLENGFAFLNPYGLPYLPGSGVKGVLRQAARELGGQGQTGWDTTSDWTVEAIEALFGHDDSNDARRGALTFWDVLPQIHGDALQVEVMTAHQSHYYQKSETPHESGQPNPINFLAIPPDSTFTFYVLCDRPFLSRQAPRLTENQRWQRLLAAAFEHAFAWLGFGAKTAVGYGAMALDASRTQERELEETRQREAQEKAARLTAATADLPDDAAWVRTHELQGTWTDKNKLLDGLEPWLAARESASPEATHAIQQVLEQQWPGITDNPEAVQGKKQKPKYKDRPRKLALRFLQLKQGP